MDAVRGTSAEDTLHHSVLKSGITVTNLRRVLGGGAGSEAPSGLGTLGFFGAERGATGAAPLLVSSSHVLFAHDARPGDPVYQPEFRLRGGAYEFDRDALHPVATLCPKRLEGHHAYRYPGEPSREYFVDCAAARLDEEYRLRFRPALPFPGVASRERIAGARRVVAADRDVRVHKWGRKTGLTAGRLVDVGATIAVEGGAERYNVIVIRAERNRRFADEGDSGALLVNRRSEAVGLVWGKSRTDPSIAFACHIHPVLDFLGLTLLTHAPAGSGPRSAPSRAPGGAMVNPLRAMSSRSPA